MLQVVLKVFTDSFPLLLIIFPFHSVLVITLLTNNKEFHTIISFIFVDILQETLLESSGSISGICLNPLQKII